MWNEELAKRNVSITHLFIGAQQMIDNKLISAQVYTGTKLYHNQY